MTSHRDPPRFFAIWFAASMLGPLVAIWALTAAAVLVSTPLRAGVFATISLLVTWGAVAIVANVWRGKWRS